MSTQGHGAAIIGCCSEQCETSGHSGPWELAVFGPLRRVTQWQVVAAGHRLMIRNYAFGQ